MLTNKKISVAIRVGFIFKVQNLTGKLYLPLVDFFKIYDLKDRLGSILGFDNIKLIV